MGKNIYERSTLSKIIAAVMAFVVAFVFVSSDIPTKAEAAERVYVFEVMLFYGNDLADAINECKKARYIPVGGIIVCR